MDSLFAIVWAWILSKLDVIRVTEADDEIIWRLIEDEDLEKVCGGRLENDRTDSKAVT